MGLHGRWQEDQYKANTNRKKERKKCGGKGGLEGYLCMLQHVLKAHDLDGVPLRVDVRARVVVVLVADVGGREAGGAGRGAVPDRTIN